MRFPGISVISGLDGPSQGQSLNADRPPSVPSPCRVRSSRQVQSYENLLGTARNVASGLDFAAGGASPASGALAVGNPPGVGPTPATPVWRFPHAPDAARQGSWRAS